MPFLTPSLTTLQQQAISDITTANLPTSTGSLLRNSVLRILAYVMAGLGFGHYEFLQYIAKQSVPFTATDEYLEAWAALKGVFRTSATASTGSVTFTGTSGTTIPSGTVVSRSDGVQYATIADGTISGGGTVTILVTATSTGSVTDDSSGNTYQLSNPIAGVNSTVTSTNLAGGTDIETDDSLRTRMLRVYANPNSGGSAVDYVEWATSVAGVTRAWVLDSSNAPVGLGTVVVLFMMDQIESAFGGLPQGTSGGATAETRTPAATGDMLLVANYIFSLQPVTALVVCAAPIAFPINVEIQNLQPSTTLIQSQITTAISNALVSIGDPTGSKVYMSEITAAIETVPGVQWYTLVSPSTPVVIPVGSLPTLGTVTWT